MLDYVVHGNEMQLVELNIDASQGIRAEVGAMVYMDSSVTMETNTGGSLLGGMKRYLGGESFYLTSFKHNGSGKGTVAFGAPYPGKVVKIDLGQHGGKFLCQKESFLCCESHIQVDIAFTKKIGAGLFGGEGFVLQRLSGQGTAFIHAGGTVIGRTLEKGKSLLVDTGCVVGLEDTVDYDIQFVGGVRNALFGGEGIFFAKLTGPGKIFLQSLPFSRLSDRILTAQKKL
jgi:uncharacterized protein (TIGR00266 family)